MPRPEGSGLLQGGGVACSPARRKLSAVKKRPTKNFPRDVHLTDYHALRNFVPDYDPSLEFAYTAWELHVLAEKMLLEDEKKPGDEPAYLTMDMYRNRQRREIQCGDGVPDPAIVCGLYWRTHPNGRAWTTKEQRAKNGSSFYR